VDGTEREISQLLYMDDLKLLGRDEDELEDDIKIVKAIGRHYYEFCMKILCTHLIKI